jgi:hypothetical protein
LEETFDETSGGKVVVLVKFDQTDRVPFEPVVVGREVVF